MEFVVIARYQARAGEEDPSRDGPEEHAGAEPGRAWEPRLPGDA